MTVPDNATWVRKASLIVSSETVGLDLSEFRLRFQTVAAETQTPNTLYVRVYNLSPQTAQKIGTNASTEFTTIMLQAGYGNNYGVIFQGTIKQTAVGQASNTGNFIDT